MGTPRSVSCLPEKSLLAPSFGVKRCLRRVRKSQQKTEPKTVRRKDQPATKYAMTISTSESTAPTHGLSVAVMVTRPSRAVRALLSAASMAPHGLRRMRTLIACEAIQTRANIAMPSGTVRRLSSQEKSIEPRLIIARPVAMECSCGTCRAIILESESIVKGTTAPAATRPEALFSIVSMTSSGFLRPAGTAAPKASLAAHAPTRSVAGSQKLSWANHGSACFSSGVLAVKYL
ncbi:MAG: hypothetical protein BWX86_02822 [Verrucomicrobia bacterium ADurb.Bin122]|nr:MAG: hypothetical protein BWX86_02822 [Verrucomicrobia bacterium ADurb.Bin122]